MRKRSFSLLLSIVTIAVVSTGCGPRVTIVTGTTIGLHASPGDGQTQPPEVTLAYKRSEVATMPTGQRGALKGTAEGSKDTEAFSTLGGLRFCTKWWGETQLDSFISTGHAARELVDGESGGDLPALFTKDACQ